MASVFFLGGDGEWLPLGEVVDGEIVARVELADGELVAWPGTCPVCARLPLGCAPVVCEHGVAAVARAHGTGA